MGPLTQEDPIGIAGGLNLYGYANGDPINFSDPFGLDPCEHLLDEEGNPTDTDAWVECKGQQYAEEDEQREDEVRADRTIRQCRAVIVNFFVSGLFDLSGGSAIRSGARLWRVGNKVGYPAAAAEGRRRVGNTLLWDVPQAAGGAGAEWLVVAGSDVGLVDFVPYVSTFDDGRDAVRSCPR